MIRRLAAASAAAVLTFGLAACSSDTKDAISVTAGPTADAVPANGSSLDAADFAAAAKIKGTTILDVRTPAEFAQGHLEGAVNMDVESPDFTTQAASLDPQGTYAIYCHSGNRSKAAMNYLANNGFTSMFDLSGGIAAWEDAGGDTVTG